ncbi:MAG: NPCBM/NEW2 domain-containing protein [Anaerolineae bacterium]
MKAKKTTVQIIWISLICILFGISLVIPFNAGISAELFQREPDLKALAAADTNYSLTDLTMLTSQAGWGPVEINQSVGLGEPNDGTPLTINGVMYEKGIGTHATSVISYDLEGKCSTFSVTMGIDDSVSQFITPDKQRPGSVYFHVFADGVEIYKSPPMVYQSPTQQTGLLSMVDVDELMLIVSDANGQYNEDHADWASPVVTCSSFPNGDGTSFKHVRGSWEPVMQWPVKAIHATLLPSGHIVSHASGDEGYIAPDDPNLPHDLTKVDLADISDWSHEWVNNTSQEMYCSAHTLLSDGRLLEFGGHNGQKDGVDSPYYGKDQASIFDFNSKTWEQQASMHQARWYPTAITLGNGDVMAIGGANGLESNADNIFKPEIFNGTEWRILNNVDYSSRLQSNNNAVTLDHTYPAAHLSSDGRVFWAGWDTEMAYIDTTGQGSWGQSYHREDIQRAWGSPVMFEPDKLLMIGGVDVSTLYGDATRSTMVVDITGDEPVSTLSDDMLFLRADADGTLLANGEVIVNGGGSYHFLGGIPSHIYVPEVWNPDTGTWTLGAAAENPRGYHSSSLLLPDGRLWTAGGECDIEEKFLAGEICPHGKTAQVYNPPYLFNEDGSFATRPVLNAAAAQITYSRPFTAEVSSVTDISKVSFIRLGSTTHHFNFEQRYLELDFQQDGDNLSIDAPAHGNIAPPGFYMLFVFDSAGVPSVSKMVQILPTEEAAWKTVTSADNSAPTARHESAYVEYSDKFYLMGGRGERSTEIFDPVTQVWTSVGNPPVQFHHIQPVVVDDLIYVVSGLVGEYPDETSLENIYIFDPSDNSWTTGPAIPAARRRGSAGVAAYSNKIYLVGGNDLGHNAGYQAWFDEYDPANNSWKTLQDAPHARDHFMAVVIGNKLYAAGGRQTDQPYPFDAMLTKVDIYDFELGQWSVLVNDLPTPRAGTLAVGHGKILIVIGGEGSVAGPAHQLVEVLDTDTGVWTTLPELITGRHSGGALIWDDYIYTVAGSGNQGGWPELTSQESLVLDPAEAPDTSKTGKILRESWIELPGYQLTDLTGAAKFAQNPDFTEMLTTFESPPDWADNYGQQVRGYIHPPVTGLYQFWIASDDEGKLFLSSDSDPANKTEIASVPGFTGFRVFTKYPEQKSVMVRLEAGQKYYIEALHKEGAGGDFLTVAWQTPDTALAIISGEYLSPFISVPVPLDVLATPTPTVNPEETTVPTATPVGTPAPSVTPVGTPTPSTQKLTYLPLIVR